MKYQIMKTPYEKSRGKARCIDTPIVAGFEKRKKKKKKKRTGRRDAGKVASWGG